MLGMHTHLLNTMETVTMLAWKLHLTVALRMQVYFSCFSTSFVFSGDADRRIPRKRPPRRRIANNEQKDVVDRRMISDVCGFRMHA